MLSTRVRTSIIAAVATFSIAGVATPPALAAGKGCTVEVTDSNGKTSTINMQDGASITIGKAELTCSNGNVSVKPASSIGPGQTTVTPVQLYRAPTSYAYR